MLMRRHGLLMTLALAAGATGCSSFLEATARNATELPVQSCDEIKLSRRDRQRAEEAWVQVQIGFPGQCWAPDYALGFKDGYADFLDNGGNGEPPAVAPFRYRLRPYQTPDGLRAIDEWFAGFRHGSSLARTSGYRELNVVPLSSPPINAVERFPNSNLPVGPPVTLPTDRGSEVIGAPRKAPAPEDVPPPELQP